MLDAFKFDGVAESYDTGLKHLGELVPWGNCCSFVSPFLERGGGVDLLVCLLRFTATCYLYSTPSPSFSRIASKNLLYLNFQENPKSPSSTKATPISWLHHHFEKTEDPSQHYVSPCSTRTVGDYVSPTSTRTVNDRKYYLQHFWNHLQRMLVTLFLWLQYRQHQHLSLKKPNPVQNGRQ